MNTQDTQACAIEQEKGPVEDPSEAKVVQISGEPEDDRDKTVIRLPSVEKSAVTRFFMLTPTAYFTWKPTRATPARWCRSTAKSTSGSTRLQFR